MVASRFIDQSPKHIEYVSLDEKTVDITNPDSIKDYFNNNKFDSIINFAAFTNLDAAETERGNEDGLVYKLNVTAVKNLAEYCSQSNVFYIQISTDFVFPGTEIMPGPYGEDDIPPNNPDGMGWYGWTKNRAEFFLKNILDNYAVVRYGFPFRSDNFEKKSDWARNLINLYEEKKMYPLFSDQVQSILLIDDLVEPLTKILSDNMPGVFHIASVDTGSPFEIGSYLLEKYSGAPVKLDSGKMLEYLSVPGRTPKPRLGGLKVENTENKLGLKFRSWRDMVDDFVSEYKSR